MIFSFFKFAINHRNSVFVFFKCVWQTIRNHFQVYDDEIVSNDT